MAKSKVSSKEIFKQEITDLPFVKKRTGNMDGNHFWTVQPSGEYIKDCQTGTAYAALALEYMKYDGSAYLLTWCVLDMPRKKKEGGLGIEVGFLSFMAKAAMSCSLSPSYMLEKDEQKHRQIMRYFANVEKEATGGEV